LSAFVNSRAPSAHFHFQIIAAAALIAIAIFTFRFNFSFAVRLLLPAVSCGSVAHFWEFVGSRLYELLQAGALHLAAHLANIAASTTTTAARTSFHGAQHMSRNLALR
jgi:hypothetical protein